MRRYFALPTILACLAAVLVATPATARPAAMPACAPAAPTRLVQKQVSPSKLVSVVTNDASVSQASIGSGIPMALVGPAGYETDSSGGWTNPADGRVYWYDASTAVWYETSQPCSGNDKFQAWFSVECIRRFGSQVANTPCTFHAHYTRLLIAPPGSGGSTWTDPWKWAKYVRGNTTACEGFNSYHSVSDGSWAKSQINTKPYFLNPFNTSETLHPSIRRHMMSSWVNQYGFKTGDEALSGNLTGPVDEPSSPYVPSPC